MNPELPSLYKEMAFYWPLFSDPADYANEAAFIHKIFTELSDKPMRKLLELGSGGGNNASHLKAHYQISLMDVSEEMLAVSRKLNPNANTSRVICAWPGSSVCSTAY